MTTVATPQMRNLAIKWASECGFKSAVVSGLVGDARHQKQGGYHISRALNPAGNYSVIRPDDKRGPSDAASAIDMTMNATDMQVCTTRLIRAYLNKSDPRRKYINAFNGWLGTGGAKRWDVYACTIKPATADHKWHIHLEIRRGFATSLTAMDAILSLLKGETVATYLKSIGLTSLAASPGTKSGPVPPFPGVLERNDQAENPDPGVKLIQQQFLKRGWTSVGEPDGYFGAKLQSVVKRWQSMCGLDPDGIIGEQTWPTVWTRPIAK